MTFRMAWRSLLRHARIIEILDRLQRIESMIADRNGLNSLNAPLEYYPGYDPGDLQVIEHFRRHHLVPEPGFIVDFLGVRTRVASLWSEPQQLAGTVVPPPIPADFHAEAVEWIGLLKAVMEARDRFA